MLTQQREVAGYAREATTCLRRHLRVNFQERRGSLGARDALGHVGHVVVNVIGNKVVVHLGRQAGEEWAGSGWGTGGERVGGVWCEK